MNLVPKPSKPAIVHKDFAYSCGLIRLWRLDSGCALLRAAGRVKLRIGMLAD